MDQDEQLAQSGMEAGIARIEKLDGSHSGMAILIDGRCAITCAHVVNVALGKDIDNTKRPDPDARVTVSFPMLSPDIKRQASIVRWLPPGRAPNSDMALLLFDEAAPREAGVAVLSDIRLVSLEGDRLDVFGMESGLWGVRVDLRFMGKPGSAWVQIDGQGTAGAFVKKGFSGGAVWDHDHETVIGMVVARRTSDDEKIAYMIPAAAIGRALPEAPVERREIAQGERIVFTLLTLGVFLVMLTHLLADRIGDYPSFLSLGFGNRALTSFYGMLIGCIMLPVLYAAALPFSRAYAQHPWQCRIPPLTFRPGARNASARTRAGIKLALLFLAPFIFQLHFLDSFHANGAVYVSNKDFKALDAGWTQCCDQADLYKRNDLAARYSLLAASPYWNNAYQYGEREGAKNRNAYTFYPLLEPLIADVGSLAALVLLIRLLLSIFKPPRAVQVERLQPDRPSADSDNQGG